MYEDSSRDMKCTLNPGIKNISGKFGGMIFRTFTRPDGSKETRAYGLPRKKDGSFGYERKSPLSKKEIAARERFKKFSDCIANMSDEQKRKYHKEWKAAKYKFNGKEYATLRGYIMARLYAENKNE